MARPVFDSPDYDGCDSCPDEDREPPFDECIPPTEAEIRDMAQQQERYLNHLERMMARWLPRVGLDRWILSTQWIAKRWAIVKAAKTEEEMKVKLKRAS